MEGGSHGKSDYDSSQGSKDSKKTIELQHEVVSLQQKIKLKDEMIQQLKNMEGMSQDAQEVFEVIEKQVAEIDQKGIKRKDSVVKDALLGKRKLSDLDTSNDSFYLSESEVEQLVNNQKMIHDRIEEELAQKRKMRQEMDELREKLNQALEETNPDIQEITTSLVEERVAEMKRSFDKERENLLSDLSNRVQKV